MKKTLIAAAIVSLSGAAFAQSSVTLFGVVDAAYRSAESGTNKFNGFDRNGIASSRLGVMGTEDVMKGLKASFHIEGDLNPDTGTPGGLTFTRKSTIGLIGGWGEVRVGRDYTPLFTVHGFDPFGTNGVGSAGNLMFSTPTNDATGAAAVTTFRGRVVGASAGANAAAATSSGTNWADPNTVRSNNSIAFYTPKFGGFSASLMYGAGNENTNLAKSAGTMTSLRLSWDQGPLSLAAANQVTKGGLLGAAASSGAVTRIPAAGCNAPATIDGDVCIGANAAAVSPTDDQKWTSNMLGGSYDLKVVKLHAIYKTDDVPTATEFKTTLLGVSAPMGALTLKGTYITKKGNTDLATQVAVGGVYDLSKRTALYATYATLDNEAGSGAVVSSVAPISGYGLKSKGIDIGVRHTF